MQIKKKLALFLTVAMLVTSVNISPFTVHAEAGGPDPKTETTVLKLSKAAPPAPKSGTTVVKLSKHVHAWEYTANGATLTAECVETAGTCSVTNKKVSLTITATSANYSGSTTGWCEADKVAFELVGKDAWESAVGTAPTIQYTGTTIDDTAYTSEDKLTVGGSYTAYIECDEKKAELSFLVGHVFEGQPYVDVEDGIHHNQKCKYCDNVNQGNHDFDAQPYQTDDTGKHYQKCKVCGNDSAHVVCTPGTAVKEDVVAPTCSDNGSHNDVVYCTVCNQKLSTTPATDFATGNHDFVNKECSVCKVKECVIQGNHDFSKQDITKATLSANGKIVTKCKDCGEIKSTTISYPKTITTVTSATYIGSQIKPAVTVKDANGKVIDATNYTLTYGTNKAYGEGTVTVTFKGNYSGSKKLTFKILPKTTSISSLANASTGITIKWAKNDQATGYKIYRSVNGGSYSLVKNITSNATVSYTDTGATTNGAKYDYKIYAYRTSGSTTYTAAASAVKTIYRLTSTISSAANATSGITVKWAKNSAATGYYVYRSVNGAAYTLIKTITSNGTVSYTDTGAKTNGSKYQYKVVAYKTVSGTTYKSAYSAVKTMYRLTSTISSAANAASGITVKWAKNSKATGYYVYRSVNGGSYSRIATIKSYATVSYTDTKATTAGAKYQYKVIAYKTVSGTNYNSASSAIKTTYRLARPAISSAANAASGITVKWAKNSKVTGYYVYRSVNGGSYSRIATIKSYATVSYTDTKATTAGAKYQYKVIAYKTVSGTNYNSASSAVKTTYRLARPAISSAANAASGITVKWAKNSKATGYYVYRSVNGGSYSKIATIKSYATVSYTDTKATAAGAKYQYKVIAYKTVSGTNYNSASSAVKTTYRLARPAISSASNSAAGKVTVKWNKISKASGYEIKYVTGTTTKTVTVTSGTTVSKVISSLKKGSTYKIYVRAYKTVSNAKYYSAWSPAKSVK